MVVVTKDVPTPSNILSNKHVTKKAHLFSISSTNLSLIIFINFKLELQTALR